MNLIKKNFVKRMVFVATVLPFTIALLCFPSCGNSDPNPVDEDKTPPAEVTAMNGIVGNAQITLNWTDPADEDFERVEITYSPGNNTVQVNKGVQTAVIGNLTNGTAYSFTLKTVDASGNASASVTAGPYTPEPSAAPAVYMTTDISSAGLMAVYNALGKTPAEGQRVAIKVTTGEPPASNYLRQALIGTFVQSVNGTYVECMTAYGGSRAAVAMAKQVAADHGFTPFDLMDEEGAVQIPTPSTSTNLTYDIVGSHINNYDFMVVLSHFKGHAMGGFGGAIKNMSIGIGTREGKCWIHSHGTSTTSPWFSDDRFRQSMAEAAGAVANKFGNDIIYINVLNRLSVDCDCNGNPAAPDMHDIGILASLDPVAIDKASYDLVKAAPDNNALGRRMDQLNGIVQVNHGAQIGIGSLEYQIVSID